MTNLTFTVVDDAGIFGQTACNVSGDATSYQIPYHTGASRKIDVSGSGTVPVRLVAYISDTTIDNVTPPKLFLQSEPTSHSISLGWEAYAVPNASRAALVDVANGQEIASFTPNVAGHDDLDCLRPNRTSSIELRAIGARFAVGSAHLRFTTLLGSECTPAAHNVPIVDAFGLVVALVAGWTATSARRAGGTRGAA